MFRIRNLSVLTNQHPRTSILLLVCFLIAMVVSVSWIWIAPPYVIPAYAWFLIDQSDLNEFAQKFDSDSSIEKISLLATEQIEFITSDGRTERIDYASNDSTDFLALMDRTGIAEAWRDEGGVVFYLRTSHKRGKLYQVAFIAEETEIPRSSFCAPKVLASIHGRCQFDLPGDWALSYEWVSLEHLPDVFPGS